MGNYMQYTRFDTANGLGFRSSIFFSGCSLKCKGCWNPASWNPRNGEPFTQETINMVLDGINHPSIDGISLLGGEPFENLDSTIPLVKQLRDRYGNSKSVWSWSGYPFELLKADPQRFELLKMLDVLVDGPFILSQRDLSLQFRGSKNQRVLNVPESLKNDEPTWLENIKH